MIICNLVMLLYNLFDSNDKTAGNTSLLTLRLDIFYTATPRKQIGKTLFLKKNRNSQTCMTSLY